MLEKIAKADRYLENPMFLGVMAVEKAVRWALGANDKSDHDNEAGATVYYPQRPSQPVEQEQRDIQRRREHDSWVKSFQLNPDAVHRQIRFRRETEELVVRQPVTISKPQHN
jgi:hypothetical protein